MRRAGAWGSSFGGADFAAAVGCAGWPDNKQIHARERVVWAARAAGLLVWDTPFFDVRDPDGAYEAALFSRQLGFDGRTAIHPNQIEPIHRAFTPTDDEVARARRIVEAWETRGVTEVDGQLVEELHARAARRLLARAEAATGD